MVVIHGMVRVINTQNYLTYWEVRRLLFPHHISPPTMSSQAGWTSVTGIATLLLDGSLVAIAIAVLITFGIPVALHIIFYRRSASPPSSNFLLLGPSGAGKTAFTMLVSLAAMRCTMFAE